MGNDKLDAGRGRDGLSGDKGDDLIEGGLGLDDARYFSSRRGITGSLATNRVTGQGHDRLGPGIDEILGSQHADRLTGDRKAQLLAGLGSDDTIVGGAKDEIGGGRGDDHLVGGERLDIDVVLFAFKIPGRVDVDLSAGTATGPGNGSDTLQTIGWRTELRVRGNPGRSGVAAVRLCLRSGVTMGGDPR